MLTEKDLKVVGIFLDCLKNGLGNVVSANEYNLFENKNRMKATIVPLKFIGMIRGFAIAELFITTPVRTGKKMIRQNQRLTELICKEIMKECDKFPILKYQYVIPALMVSYADLLQHLRRYEHCVKFEQLLAFGKLMFFADSIDEMLETGEPEPADSCDVQSYISENVLS